MTEPTNVHPAVGDRLRSFIERIERLIAEKQELSADIKEAYSEAKGVGFDPMIMKKVIVIRAMDPEDRSEQEQLLLTYLNALGPLEGDPE